MVRSFARLSSGRNAKDSGIREAVQNGLSSFGHVSKIQHCGSLRISHLTLGEPKNSAVVFIPGYMSRPNTWRMALPSLLDSYDVFYVETPEKYFVGDREAYSPWLMASELRQLLDARILESAVGIVAASTGANLAIEALRIYQSRGTSPEGIQWVALLMPHLRVPLPWWTPVLGRLPVLVTSFVVHFAVLTLKFRRENSANWSAQRNGLLDALQNAKPAALRGSALSWKEYELEAKELHPLEIPTLVIGVSKDPLHNWSASRDVSSAMNAELRDVGTFQAAHSTRCMQELKRWIARLDSWEGYNATKDSR